MESAVDFLRRKGVLDADKTKFLVKFDDGREVDLVDLLTEHASPSTEAKTFMALRARRGMILSDLVDDEIENSVKLYNSDIAKFFEKYPDWKTEYNLNYLQFEHEGMRQLGINSLNS